MSVYEKALIVLIGTFVVLVLLFGAAAILVPDFRLQGSTIVGVILAALTTMASTLGGAYIAKDLRRKKKGEDNDR